MEKYLSNYLKKITENFDKDNIKLHSTNSIANNINLSRSTVSSYLNKEVKRGNVIKVKEYPVIFLDKDVFSKFYFKVELSEYESLEELFNENKSNSSKASLNNVIGAKGSLKEQIDQIKTAILYPQNGLPIMLLGPSGSGKTYLAKSIYDYSIQENLISKKAPFISLNCAQYYHNPELLSSILFGHAKGSFTGADKDKKGLLENADGGILFLDEVHRLTDEGQEKLFTFMDSGEFSPFGDNSIKKKAKVRLIFATTESIQSTFLPTFIRRLPVIVNIPSFSERPQHEKLNLIDSFFLKESEILNKSIKVSGQVISFLLSSNYEGNVGKIKNIVKYSCGSSYTRGENTDLIKVKITDLPTDCEEYIKETFNYQFTNRYQCRSYDYRCPELLNISSREEKNIATTYFQFIEEFKSAESGNITYEYYIKKMMSNVNILLDDLVFNTEYAKNQSLFSILSFNIRHTFKFMEENYGTKQDGNKIISIASLLYFKEEHEILINHPDWNSIRPKLITFINNHMANSVWLAKLMLRNLSEQLDYEFLEEDLIVISFYLNSTSMQKFKSGINAIILAHGYSTASSMANVANRLLKKNFFQAIDMPIDITIDDIENKIIEFIDNNNIENGLILLVDMGSLSDLGNRLKEKIKGPLLLIDYVSTPLVLEVGSLLIKEKNINEINNEVLNNVNINRKLIYPTEKKKKAILTCCYTGMGSAIQIQEILENSLKQYQKSLTIIPYDYKKLKQNKLKELPFQVYKVIAIIGTNNPKIEGVNYIGLDQLIVGDEIDEFISLLKCNFEIDEEQLKKDLVFNFSIKKIIENLTILDVGKILKSIEKAVDKMEEKFDINLSNNRRFLLYLHTCCMVERILRKEKVDEQLDIDEFLKKQKRKIEVIKYSFAEIEKEYTIEISDLEIRLIFDILFTE
ncbi:MULTISPECIES: sigma 54-interacting transcriptional regulator [unclassified Clostridioides]|uniref:sigma 54-interacting transcriptional regulator n=1 Tax=unclassified Clostridioides TaxID=2635829 RepID=UPI001D11C86A|nr:sigma 54-interacting transcriptional regulator [Clostridioides sp. ES-S-0171-01]MCC0689820.1 sigma 54-interacting transcriptional regulator [Clostridioides sp. ES-S-0056-01]MCC0715665.1 sigma 54-interacting transcriptional regulator [Clostridioides sp. ES-S-0077-01]UDN54466.1 sigma 54-interacting transcriptional regulator [Clostridioides sp. ES-S-0054-01]